MPVSKRDTLTAIWRVVTDPRLSDREVRVWLAYRHRDFNGNGTFVSDDRLAEDIGKSRRTIERARQRLLELGYLRQQLRGPDPALYWAEAPTNVAEQRSDRNGESTEDPTDDPPHVPPDLADRIRKEYGCETGTPKVPGLERVRAELPNYTIEGV